MKRQKFFSIMVCGVKSLGICICGMLLWVKPIGAAESWEVEWKKTVEAAKKEGRVNLYITNWGIILREKAFQKAYPGIKLVGVTGRGSQIRQRILTQRRAGKYITDVVSGGTSTTLNALYPNGMLDPIKPALILPEVVDESLWWKGKHSYLDPEGQYVFRYTGTPQYGAISYNSKLVNPKEIKSFWDFLDPKWNGKILVRDLRAPGPGGLASRFLYYHPKVGREFLKRLITEMDATIFRDIRQSIDWLGSGKFAICFFCHRGFVRQAKFQGLPVETFGAMKEGVGISVQAGTLALMNNAPHPNAAKVFINWYLSREGQLTLLKATSAARGGGGNTPDSLRIDIPKDMVPPENRRVEGYDYFDVDSRPEWRDRRPIRKIVAEVMAKKKKK